MNSKSKNGTMTLNVAVTNAHMEVVRFLVDIGANSNAKDVNGESTLHVVARNGHTEVMRLLFGQCLG